MAMISAIFFGIGDFIVVFSEQKKMDVITLYMTYTIVIGAINLLYLVLFKKESIKDIIAFNTIDWTIVAGLSFFYFLAYMLHFIAIQKATNPGYANALVMLHVIVLTMLSYFLLSKPLDYRAVFGIGVMFIGGYLVTMYA